MDNFVEMTVDSIRVHMSSGQHVVILKETDGPHFLPIWIGVSEANSIALKITGITPERPITHDLIVNMLETLHVRIDRIVVTELSGEVFYAQIVAEGDGKTIAIDARPSDAIAIAVRVDAKILVAQTVVDQAGIIPSDDDQDEEGGDGEGSDERLSQIRDWINTLDLPDLGNDSPPHAHPS